MKSRSAAFMLLASTVLAAAGCKPKDDQTPPVRPVLSVVIAPVTQRTLGFSGTIQPRYGVDLGFRLPGRMIARNADVGSVIRSGDVLASLDPVALVLAVRTSAANVATARAQVINASDAEGRQRILRGQNVVPQSQYETAQLGKETATASAEQAEADLAKATEQLRYTQLRSDMDGVVTAISAQVGQVVTAGQAVMTVARPDVREATIDVPDDVANALRPGTPFEVLLQLDPAITAAGQVREIAPQADALTRTRRVRIALAEPKDVFRLGTVITASVKAPLTQTIDLPRSALLEQDGKRLVWIVDPRTSTVATREVTVAGLDNAHFQVAAGLEPGMRIVTAGVHSLVAGQRVKITGMPAP